ncbi:MAG: HEPN domain-containing protein [Thermodesulfovibrionales bacterium]
MKNEEIASLIRYRLEQAQTAINDAKFLLEGKRSPQSIVNRAYYAMFYSVLALLQNIGKVPSKHTGVISLFDTEFVLKGIFPKELSKNFHKAFELKQVSDYKTFKPISKEKAEETLKNAVHFVEVVTKYFSEQVKL